MAATTVRIIAPAKVNLHLAVGARRADGYHKVTTVLQALELADTVTITAGVPFSFSCTPDLDLAPRDNLAHRAAHALADRLGRPAEVSVAVEKRIPAAAGLGGASSDAAAVLCGLAQLWDLPRDDPALVEVARALGADVPFFLVGGAALFTGRGDVFVRALPPLDAPVVLIRPREPVPTAAAYEAFDALPASPAAEVRYLADALRMRETARVAELMYNGLTRASESLVPPIREALDLLADDPGVLGAAMAGSGSAVFGICSSRETAVRLTSEARRAGFWAETTHTADHGCRIVSV